MLQENLFPLDRIVLPQRRQSRSLLPQRGHVPLQILLERLHFRTIEGWKITC